LLNHLTVPVNLMVLRLSALPSIEQLNGHNYNPKQTKQKKCEFLLMSQGAFSKNTNPFTHKSFKAKN